MSAVRTVMIKQDKRSKGTRPVKRAKDASSVDYRNLSRDDQKTFNGACSKEMNGLLDLGAYRL
eukprot:9510937-Karenia_brevis.AAC.1